MTRDRGEHHEEHGEPVETERAGDHRRGPTVLHVAPQECSVDEHGGRDGDGRPCVRAAGKALGDERGDDHQHEGAADEDQLRDDGVPLDRRSAERRGLREDVQHRQFPVPLAWLGSVKLGT